MSVATAAELETGTSPRPSECPCQDRRDLGPRPCFLEVSSPEFLSWREAAIRRLLEVEVDPLTREGELRLDPFTRVGLDNDLDDLEEAAVHASLATGVALPEAQARVWVPRYWRARGPRLTRRLAVDAKELGSAAAVMAALQRPVLIRYLAWQAAHERGEFEAWLLGMEALCDRRHLAALRRTADGEARAQRTQQRARAERADRSKLAVSEGVSLDDALPLALEALATYVQANADRIWRGRHDRRVRRRSEAGWIGRWDAPDQVVALDGEVVRAVLGRFGDPADMLRLMAERGLIKRAGARRDLRWQRRVGERGTRMSCVGIVPAVVTGVTHARQAT